MVDISKKDLAKLQKLANKAYEAVEALDEFIGDFEAEEDE